MRITRIRVTLVISGKIIAYNISENAEPAGYIPSRGDIVRYSINRNYEISMFEKICDVQPDGSMVLLHGKKGKPGEENPEADYCSDPNITGAVCRIVSGNVYDYADGLLCLSKGDVNGTIDRDNPKFEYYRGIADASICVIDEDEITVGSDDDIIRYVDNAAKCSKAFITTRHGAVRDVIIYK